MSTTFGGSQSPTVRFPAVGSGEFDDSTADASYDALIDGDAATLVIADMADTVISEDAAVSDPTRTSELAVVGELARTPTGELGVGPVGGSTQTPEPTVRPRRRIWIDLGVYAVFLMIALWVVGKFWAGGRISSDDASDQAFFEWMLAHGAQVVTHGASPLFASQLNVPTGVNLMANTSILALSIPIAPITLLFGPAVSYAVLLMLGLAGTAGAWYFVLSRHVVRARSAAIIGGVLAGFGPAMIAHSNGHPNIISQFLIPFLAWRVLRMREPGRVVRNGVSVGLLVVAQVFINEEILFITAIALAILLACLAFARRDEARAALRPFLTALGIAAGVAGVLLAYPLWQQFFGPQSYHGLNPDLLAYGTDLAAFGAFGGRTVVGSFTNTSHLSPNPVEQNAFFGVPMILTFGVAIYWLRRSKLAIGLAVTAGVLAVLSLGKDLIINGAHTSIPLPWWVLSKLPVFDSVVPTRMSLLVLPVMAVIVALAHDHVIASYGRGSVKRLDPNHADAANQAPAAVESGATVPRRSRLRRPRLVWLTLLVVALATLLPIPISTVAETPAPAFIASGTWKNYVAANQTLVSVPLPQEGAVDGMFWAADDDLAIQLPRGYFLGPDPAHGKMAIFGAPDRPTATLLETVEEDNRPAVVHSGDRKAAIADLRYWHAAVVIQVPGAQSDKALRATLTDLLGFKPKYSGGVWVWDVRHLLAGKSSVLG
jgi:hypothetical protein